MFSPKKILVTTDFRGESDTALKTAVDIAGKFKSEVYLMHVLEEVEPCVAEYCIITLSEDDIKTAKKNLMASTSKKLKEEIERAVPKGETKVSEVIRFGNPIDEIIREVDEKNIDLLVVAPHEHHKSWNIFFSHLSDELVKKSSCKTLLVRN